MSIRFSLVRQTRLLTCGICVMLLAATCHRSTLNTQAVTKFDVTVHSNFDNTKNHPANAPFSVSASCDSSEQLVGGGYLMVTNNTGYPNLVAVEGTYPSTSNTWTVQVRNPDAHGYSGDSDVSVQVVAYCVTTPNYDLSIDIQQR